MSYVLAEAAAACGLDKSTVRRAVRKGRISGTRDELGVWHVEASELHRVFPPAARPTPRRTPRRRRGTPQPTPRPTPWSASSAPSSMTCGATGMHGVIRPSALPYPPQCGPGGDASLGRRQAPEKRA
jgi:hypothetical protein